MALASEVLPQPDSPTTAGTTLPQLEADIIHSLHRAEPGAEIQF